MKKRSELFFSLILVPIDYLMMVAGFVVAYILRVKIEAKPTFYQIPAIEYLQALLVLLPIWVIIFALNGLYNLSSTRNRINELVRVMVATGSGVMVLVIIDFFSINPLFPSKSVPIYGLLFSFIFIYSARLIIRAIQKYLFHFGIGVHNIILLGNGEQARELDKKLSAKNSGYKVVFSTTNKIEKIDINEIKRINSHYHIDEIILVNAGIEDEELIEIIRYADHNHISYKYTPSLAGLYQAHVVTTTLAGMPIVEMIKTPLEGWGRIVKRIFDLVLSSIALVVLSPIFIIIAVVIKLSDPGPVFYRHKRISKAGRSIEVIKFRSMYVQYSDGAGFSGKSAEKVLKEIGNDELVAEFKKDYKLKNDPRVHPFGRFLRKTSLDELPQLVNVVMGQLSLVGPRPIIEEELQKYGTNASRLLSIKPGLTGLWQVSGRNDISYEERAKLELYYVEHWSLLLDIIILLKTLRLLFQGSDGY